MATALAAAASSAASPSDGVDAMTLRRASAFYGDSPDPGRLGLATVIRGVTFDVDSLTLTELRLLVARLVYTHPAIVSKASSHVLKILRNDDSEDGDGREGGDIRGRLGGTERRRGGSGGGGGDDAMDDYGEGDGDGGRSPPPESSPSLPEPLDPAEADDPNSEDTAVDGMGGDGTPSVSHVNSATARNSGGAKGASSGMAKRGSAKRAAGKQKSPPTKRKRNRPKRTRATWDDRFDELCRVKELLGHTKPTREWVDQHTEYRSLFHWMNNMRAYRTKIVAGEKPAKSTLTMERMEKLDSIGFEWAVPRSPHTTWEDRFEKTLELKSILGHTKPSAQWLRDNPSWDSWAGWAKRQRACEKAAREGRKSEGQGQFTEERRRKLDAVGFEWWK